eukprot:1160509-Pelagomonas_calceolata.AAC.8
MEGLAIEFNPPLTFPSTSRKGRDKGFGSGTFSPLEAEEVTPQADTHATLLEWPPKLDKQIERFPITFCCKRPDPESITGAQR